MNWIDKNGVRLLTVPSFEKTGLVHAAFSTRIGGVSEDECATMNFSFARKDTKEHVRENYKRFCDAVGADVNQLVITKQVHSDRVMEPTLADVGRLIVKEEPVQEADAMITDRTGWVLIKHCADCVPVLLLDPVRKVVGAVHAGWRGTVESIVSKTVQRMTERYGCNPGDMLAAIGPSIGPCCFEVGDEVANAFNINFPHLGLVDQSKNRTHVNLWACNRIQLERSGLAPMNITESKLCTSCHTDIFYSHRRENGHCGAMIALISLIG